MGLSFQPCVTARELCAASRLAAGDESINEVAGQQSSNRGARRDSSNVSSRAAGRHCGGRAETAASAVTIPWRRSGLAYPWLACWLSSVEIESVTPPQHQQHCPLLASRTTYCSLLPFPPSPSLPRTAPSPPALTAAFARTCPLSSTPTQDLSDGTQLHERKTPFTTPHTFPLPRPAVLIGTRHHGSNPFRTRRRQGRRPPAPPPHCRQNKTAPRHQPRPRAAQACIHTWAMLTLPRNPRMAMTTATSSAPRPCRAGASAWRMPTPASSTSRPP